MMLHICTFNDRLSAVVALSVEEEATGIYSQHIYLFSLYAYNILDYFCTDYMDKRIYFFSTKGAIISEAFSQHLFA